MRHVLFLVTFLKRVGLQNWSPALTTWEIPATFFLWQNPLKNKDYLIFNGTRSLIFGLHTCMHAHTHRDTNKNKKTQFWLISCFWDRRKGLEWTECHSPLTDMLKSWSLCDSIWSGAFGRWLGPEGGVLLGGISGFLRRGQRASLQSFHHVRTREETPSATRKRIFTRTRPCWHPGHPPDCEAWFCCLSHSVCGNVLWQPE